MKKLSSFALPESIEHIIIEQLHLYGYHTDQSQKLAGYVKKLSDYFIENPGAETPWSEKWAQIAYWAYFFPLNYLRNRAVMQDLAQWVPRSMEYKNIVDVGAGLGTASLAWQQHGVKNSYDTQFLFIEKNEPLKKINADYFQKMHPQAHWQKDLTEPKKIKSSLVLFSYSFLEMQKQMAALQDWLFCAPVIVLLEPSVQDHARQLMQFRQVLIENGYEIAAPCVHQKNCPLLAQPKDWCHHRIEFAQPLWFEKMEQHLPMRNKTLTYSYLIAVKNNRPAEDKNSHTAAATARVIGDLLQEKGKDRQMVCAGETRQFLSWLHRQKNTQILTRGSVIQWPLELSENKSSELRPQQDLTALWFPKDL
ncbi:MAG: small ribosomal subunit Rsm22 family protein [Pseudobdellovibrionaceae bacterium]